MQDCSIEIVSYWPQTRHWNGTNGSRVSGARKRRPLKHLIFESIDAVALGSEIEEHFGQTLPFAEFLTRAGEQELDDITIGNLLDFLMSNLNESAGKAGR